jgi:hypothetical protein
MPADALCSHTITSADDAVAAVTEAKPVSRKVLYEAVGPVGGSARRLFKVWRKEGIRQHSGH